MNAIFASSISSGSSGIPEPWYVTRNLLIRTPPRPRVGSAPLHASTTSLGGAGGRWPADSRFLVRVSLAEARS